MKYLSTQETANKWAITNRRVQYLCMNDRIEGAVKVGSTWIIPDEASKPIDARVNTSKDHKTAENPIKKTRKIIKKLVDAHFKGLNTNNDGEYAVKTFIGAIAACLICDTANTSLPKAIKKAESFFSIDLDDDQVNKLYPVISKYTSEYPFCVDDTLSWSYQFSSKAAKSTNYINTQFFTEKYMVRSIVNQVKLDSSTKKILDPCCGGANFLLYCMEQLLAKQDLVSTKTINHVTNILYGYEIDPILAKVAACNIKLKGLLALGNRATLKDFDEINTNIFSPKEYTICGSLDINPQNQIVINSAFGFLSTLATVISDADAIFTNPPFETIKGMSPELKKYLNSYYPNAKCDLCNAFINRIANILPKGKSAGMVTQNSWLYLNSFTAFRKEFLSSFQLRSVIELGSSAFYDISGEKSNVALVVFKNSIPVSNSKVIQLQLSNKKQSEKELALSKNILSAGEKIGQLSILKNPNSRFDLNKANTFTSSKSEHTYKDFGIAMQGTSTGNAKELIDFFWKHIGDNDWVLVSKGGGYSRWQGLNQYCVKWGKDGEYIKNTKGSAIRNATYFKETKLVYSDTGTAGLNVRLLLPQQIFVASGPGIRFTEGNKYAHMAFLNSRYVTYFVKSLSPKMTIAAGYINQIPVKESVLQSNELAKLGACCASAKKNRLVRRTNNIEFKPIVLNTTPKIEKEAENWFYNDLKDEWTQLKAESQIDDIISDAMNLSDNELRLINQTIGQIKLTESENKMLVTEDISSILSTCLLADCTIKRTKVNKISRGCDGLIEFIAQSCNCSFETAYNLLNTKDCYEIVRNNYENLYMHALLLSCIGYTTKRIDLKKIIQEITWSNETDKQFFIDWMLNSFNSIHAAIHYGFPIYNLDIKTGIISKVEY